MIGNRRDGWGDVDCQRVEQTGERLFHPLNGVIRLLDLGGIHAIERNSQLRRVSDHVLESRRSVLQNRQQLRAGASE